MEKKYIVKLTAEERSELNKILSNGNAAAKKHKIAKILLLADVSQDVTYTDQEISDEAEVSYKTIARIRKKIVEGGLEKVFEKKFTPRYRQRRFDGESEAKLIAICCGKAPEGRARWTLRLLSDKIVECVDGEISYETVRRTLKKTNLSLGKKKNGVFHQKPMRNLSAKWKMC